MTTLERIEDGHYRFNDGTTLEVPPAANWERQGDGYRMWVGPKAEAKGLTLSDRCPKEAVETALQWLAMTIAREGLRALAESTGLSLDYLARVATALHEKAGDR